MTADERLEKLLNRAGQTISDLPGPFGYTTKQEEAALEAAADFGGEEPLILHQTDIIDRMETALENVIGERDWLRANYSANPNETVPEEWRADDETD